MSRVQDERDPGDCIIELDELGTPIAYSPIEGKNLSRVPPTAIYDGMIFESIDREYKFSPY